jgi:small subunit ribosomal protein S16
MLKIRFQRTGKKNMPHYRLVLAESTSAPRGKFMEVLGNYDPRKKTTSIDGERILHWLSKGVKLSDTAHNFLIKHGIIKGKKIAKHKKPEKSAVAPQEQKQDSESAVAK